MGLREPLPVSERHWPVRDPEECKQGLFTYAGRLAVVVNPGVAVKDAPRRDAAAALTEHLRSYDGLQLFALQSVGSMMLQQRKERTYMHPRFDSHAATEIVRHEFARHNYETTTINGVHLPTDKPALAHGLLFAAEQLQTNVAGIAIVAAEHLDELDIPTQADHGDAFVLNASPRPNKLTWTHVYDSPLSHL